MEELEAVRKDYQVFTAIEQQLKDGLKGDGHEVLEAMVEIVLKVIEQHKADLFSKYNL